METGIRIYPTSIEDRMIIEEVLDYMDMVNEYDEKENCFFIPEAKENCKSLAHAIDCSFDDLVCEYNIVIS